MQSGLHHQNPCSNNRGGPHGSSQSKTTQVIAGYELHINTLNEDEPEAV